MQLKPVSEGERPPMDLAKALMPVAVGAKVLGGKEGDGKLVCIQVNGLPKGYDKQPTDPADLIPTVFAFDSETFMLFLEFVFNAGFMAFGPGPFLANMQGAMERLAKGCEDPNCKTCTAPEPEEWTATEPSQEVSA